MLPRPWVERAITDYRRQSRPWMEFVLPLYTLAAVAVYYRPQVLPPEVHAQFVDGTFRWLLWAIFGGLTGMLVFSAFMLAFFLLYSPVYIISNAWRLLDPHVWVDRGEARFYVACFLMLCALILSAFLNAQAALTTFVLLAGFATLVWRILV